MNASHDRNSITGYRNARLLATGLGWFSIGLGVAAFFMPNTMERVVGVRRRSALFRFVGLREIASGIGILSGYSSQGLWSRVIGDVIDIALLRAGTRGRGADRRRLATATATVAGIAALDTALAIQQSPRLIARLKRANTSHVVRSTIVERSPEELYQLWRNPENLARFMGNVESIRNLGDNVSHWIVKGPVGSRVEWDSRIVEDRPNRLIAWRSVGSPDVDHSGSVEFEPATGGRGTVVRVTLDYTPPGGVFGIWVARLSGRAPETQVSVNLHRFEQLVETGSVTTTEGQSAGRSRSTSAVFDDLVRP